MDLLTIATRLEELALELRREAHGRLSLQMPVSLEIKKNSEEATILARVLDWSHSNQDKFIGREPTRLRSNQEWAGFVGRWDREDWEFIAFFPEALCRLLMEWGYTPRKVFSAWRDRGWIQTRDSKKFTARVRILGTTEVTQMVKFPRAVVEAVHPSE